MKYTDEVKALQKKKVAEVERLYKLQNQWHHCSVIAIVIFIFFIFATGTIMVLSSEDLSLKYIAPTAIALVITIFSLYKSAKYAKIIRNL